MKLCSKCHEKPVPPAQLKRKSYRCSRCINSTASGKARRKRYMQRRRQTAAGQAYERELERRRIRYGDRAYGTARTVEEAQRIRAYIKERTLEFEQGQSRRAETEGVSARAIPPQAEP